MAFTEDELWVLRLLLREELQSELRSLRTDIDKRFDKIATQIDGLYQRDEKREQKYLSIRSTVEADESPYN